MLTFLFLLLTIIGFAGFFLKEKFNEALEKPNFWTWKTSLTLIMIGVIFQLIDVSSLMAREGHKYYVLSPTGQRTVVSNPGIKFFTPFSTVQEWEKYIDIKTIPVSNDGTYLESTEGIEGIIPNGVSVRFIDKVNGQVYISARFEVPVDDQAFIKLVETYRHPKNLVNNTLIPTINEQLTNVTFMYLADDYVSGAASDYKMTIEDALKNGGFVVKKVEVRDTIWNDELFLNDSIVGSKPRTIREIRSFVRNEKVEENGIPKRIPHEITANGIITAQVIVSDLALEPQFEEKLTQQRDISAEKIIEIQKIDKARASQQRVVAEGERDKAMERVKQEREQITKLIAVETKVKEEESNRQLAEIGLETEKLKAQSVKVKADAESYQNRQLVSAGLTPQERALIDKETAIGVAAELAKIKFPETMIMTGDAKGGTPLESLIGASMAKHLTSK